MGGTARNATWDAWVVLTERPIQATNPERQHRLNGDYGSREVHGRTLEPWQYEVTSGGPIWYCPDPEKIVVWLTRASTRHPKETE